ncbi:peptidylprolyl isomerase [Methylocella sp. CPCC 101449]|jgi:peptidyl-prolyl cis-trans isomerase SurA|uniref:peptidylprolyl isomerase n=1 Tax=Methylocella sp. CPCC 101449 TaxID=2987531 RepID=UPI00288D1EFD|nr:peptidylprolyl isomerase [Methylocella sp. CPCC 101449]MDT2021527.1 peptidylprolyl isomerase [Methylocella sp. CPCC 101449]HEV2571619.1 peptidylprolyl isomerase [Beijerinckiaceae bacterium]
MLSALIPGRNALHLSFAAMLLAAGTTALPLPGLAPAAHAQALVATVNDSPITNQDVEQRMRILRVMRKPATNAAALESIYESRLKLAETGKYSLKPSEQDAINELARVATEMKLRPQALLASIQGARVDKQAIQEYFGAMMAWRSLVGALNKNVSVPESEVRAELAKQGAKAAGDYRLRQVIFVVPRNASGDYIQSRSQMAQQLRGRFNDCQSGIQLARSMNEVVVREQMTRGAAGLSPELMEILDKTPVGQLTPPQRGAEGIEMIAVCGKSQAGSDSGAAENIRQTLLSKRLEGVADRLYKPLRDRAIIVQR